MEILIWMAAGFFLPLFPFTVVFNALFQRFHQTWLRTLLVLLWPLPGIALLSTLVGEKASSVLPDWLLIWALLTALLYGFRGIVVKELGIWSGYVVTSAWSLLWITYGFTAIAFSLPLVVQTLILQALSFSLPLVGLIMLITELERRYDSAYAGIVSGVAQAQPVLAGLITLFTLALIASPIFPSFFFMLFNITLVIKAQPVLSAGLAMVWLLWSWSAMRLLQDLLVGPPCSPVSTSPQRNDLTGQDVSKTVALLYGSIIVMLGLAGIVIAGEML